MKKYFFILLFIPGFSFAEGPILKQTDPMKSTYVQQEFENVYKDLRRIVHQAGFVATVATGTTVTSTARTTNSYGDSTLTATITLKYATSKVLVQLNQTCDLSTTGLTGSLQVLRGSTVVYGPYPYYTSIGNFQSTTIPIFYYDAPATTGAVTYKTQIALTGGSGTLTCQDSFGGVNTQSQIMLQEITQ